MSRAIDYSLIVSQISVFPRRCGLPDFPVSGESSCVVILTRADAEHGAAVDIPGGPETSERVWTSVEGEERKGRLDETGAAFPGFIRLNRASDETRFMSGNHRVPFSPRPVPHPASAVRPPSISLHPAVDSPSSMAYACKCLNIRIESRNAPSEQPPQLVSNPEFAPVFIGQDGIRVVSKRGRPPCRVSHPTLSQSHPQVTLRTRSRGIPISGTSQCTRYTSLTCLVCQTLVYRVHQVVPLDMQGQEGPQLPTEEWVEQEIMKSSSGWIEVHNQCSVSGMSLSGLVLQPDAARWPSYMLLKVDRPTTEI